MIIDSSAWIDYVRGADTPVVAKVADALTDGVAASTDAVRLEVLAGTWRGVSVETLGALLDVCRNIDQLPREDVEAAAALYRRCRSNGETIRAQNHCLIAAIAIRTGVPVLHKDRDDYDVIARYSELQVTRA